MRTRFGEYAARFGGGAAYAALTILAARRLIRNLGVLSGRIARLAASEEAALSAEQILGQLQSAAIESPWLAGLLVGAILGLLLRTRRRMLWGGVALFVPLTLAALWFTVINDIRLGALLRQLIPMVGELL